MRTPRPKLTDRSDALTIVKALQQYFKRGAWASGVAQSFDDSACCIGGAACKLAGLEPAAMYDNPPVIRALATAFPKVKSDIRKDPNIRVYAWNDVFGSKADMLKGLDKVRAKLEARK